MKTSKVLENNINNVGFGLEFSMHSKDFLIMEKIKKILTLHQNLKKLRKI